MTPFTFKYQTIAGYRELPSKWRIVDPEDHAGSGQRYLEKLDAKLRADERDANYPTAGEDIIAQVFANQLRQKNAGSYALASMIAERRLAARKHRRDIQWRLEQLMESRPVIRAVDGSLCDVEKQILDLEKQKRLIDVTEWRDLTDLRKAIVEQRQDYHATRARMNYLAGGYAGAN